MLSEETISHLRYLNYGTQSITTKNIMFCLLAKALDPNSSLVMAYVNGKNWPMIRIRNQYYNIFGSTGSQDAKELIYEITADGKMVQYKVDHLAVHDIRVIEPAYLQSHLGFFEANKLVALFKVVKQEKANAKQTLNNYQLRNQHV